MNFLKKGPEIKLSEIKVPNFVVDVYYDLKERHLLPVALVLLVAIVAVPIALSRSSGSEEAEAETAGTSATASTSNAGSSSQMVAKSMPGLRDYRRRLEGHAKNPFKQQYVNGESGSGEGGSSGGESAGSESSTGTTEIETSNGGGTSTESGGETETGTRHSKLTYYSYAIDIRVTTGGAQNEGEEGGARQSSAEGGAESAQTSARRSAQGNTTVRRNLPELTMLPSRKTPAVIYMGSTKDGKKALLVVSSNVTSIFGDAKCVLGSQTCEMIALEPGLPETFVYGGNGRTFKIELLKIHLVETGKLNRAPLGKPKQGKGKKSGGSG
jgi:hypothetical protein